MTVLIIVAGFVALALAVQRYGADTRTGDSWNAGSGLRPGPRSRASVRADLATAARLLTRVVPGR